MFFFWESNQLNKAHFLVNVLTDFSFTSATVCFKVAQKDDQVALSVFCVLAFVCFKDSSV